MKATIKKEITQEVEITLPYYSTNGNNYYKIVSDNPSENLSDRKSTRLNSSHMSESRMPSSA